VQDGRTILSHGERGTELDVALAHVHSVGGKTSSDAVRRGGFSSGPKQCPSPMHTHMTTFVFKMFIGSLKRSSRDMVMFQ
jgi:hypothetical protein